MYIHVYTDLHGGIILVLSPLMLTMDILRWQAIDQYSVVSLKAFKGNTHTLIQLHTRNIVTYSFDKIESSIEEIGCGAVQPEDAAWEEGMISEYKVHHRSSWF